MTEPSVTTSRGAGAVLAVDLGGTKIEAALVTPDGGILTGSRHRLPTGRSLDVGGLAAAVAEVGAAALAALPRGEVTRAGIGTAGPIDRDNGTIFPVNLPAVHGFSLAGAVADLLRAHGVVDPTVRFGHDGGCLALAESTVGATRGARASMAMVVSTGIGGGIVMDGMPVAGASGNGGHLGQMRSVGGDGLTLEEIASGPASVRWAREQGWTGATGEELATASAAGDRIARAAIVRSAEAVGAVLADITTLLDLEVIAIGGGFSRVSDDYVTLVQQQLAALALLPYARQTQVVSSGLGGDGPLVGAAALALTR